MEKLLFGDWEDCLNPVEELLDGLQSAMEEFCENLSEFGATIGEGLSYMEENWEDELETISGNFLIILVRQSRQSGVARATCPG